MTTTAPLPVSGPLPRPGHPEAAAASLRAEAFTTPSGVTRVVFHTDEFTSLCPRTGQPDFCSVTITLQPRLLCLESKSLKHYLWAYRDEGAFTEDVASRIAAHLRDALLPRAVTVEVRQNVRGGIGLTATANLP